MPDEVGARLATDDGRRGGVTRRQLLAGAAIASTALAVGGPDPLRAGAPAIDLVISVSKGRLDPKNRRCRIFEYEIRNRGFVAVYVNDFHLSWPTGKDAQATHAPQPLEDEVLGWLPGESSRDRRGTRHVGWDAVETLLLEHGDTTAVRLHVCCPAGRFWGMVKGHYNVTGKRTFGGPQESIQLGSVELPSCV